MCAISVRVFVSARANSVYPIFSDAGRKWLHGDALYGRPSGDLDLFRYCPVVAAGFAPLSLLPDAIGGIIWRWLNAAVFVAAIVCWCRTWGRSESERLAIFLLVVPLAIGGLNNGQCNALVAGFLLIAATAFRRDRLMLAAAALSAAIVFKVYPMALGLLFCLLEPRRFAPRLALAIVVGLALPYLFQRPEYVTHQYAGLVNVLQHDDRTERPIHAGYRDLHMLLRRAGWQTSLPTYRAMEVAAGLACAAVVLAGVRRGWDRPQAVDACLALGSIWMTLFGPATESSTYVLLAPVLGRAVLEVAERPRPQRLIVYASFGLFTLGAVIVWFPQWIAYAVQTSGVQPVAALLLLAHVVIELRRNRPAAPACEVIPPRLWLRAG
jgi:hypothetical protein